MRILIDECLDWRLCRALSNHECFSVQQMGWAGLKNGALLTNAQQDFDIFVTGDLNLTLQQQVSKFNIAVVVLHAESTMLHHTLDLMPKLLAAVPMLTPGSVLEIIP